MKVGSAGNPARHEVGSVNRFDQKNCMFKRAAWDPPFQRVRASMNAVRQLKNRDGNSHEDLAFKEAAWYLDHAYGETGKFSSRIPAGLKLQTNDPATMAQHVKKAARFFGASQVGICELDRRWVYSHSYEAGEHKELELAADIRYAVVLTFEMNYHLVRTSPTFLSDAATGKGYSMIPFTTDTLALYIRGMGYQAIPAGNNIALSIPLAVDAGLGELGRNGLLITKEFGPRVIVGKVLTNLPLAPDAPVELGVTEFCASCVKCARYCPSQAILRGERTSDPLNICNASGVLKWPVDAEKCYAFWAENEEACLTCVRVCPYNKPSTWPHQGAKSVLRRAPWLAPIFLRVDDLLGYGRLASAKTYWSS